MFCWLGFRVFGLGVLSFEVDSIKGFRVQASEVLGFKGLGFSFPRFLALKVQG